MGERMEQLFTVTAWNNGKHHDSGAGYGLRVSAADRDRYFKREWGTVTLQLPGVDHSVGVNIDKDSFWRAMCRELISKEIGVWLLKTGAAPWPSGAPPKVLLRPQGAGVFEVSRA
jgi:hypothetical protein